MAYVPTLADTQEAISGNSKSVYIPSLVDTHEAMAQPQMAQPQNNPSLPFRLTGDLAAGLAMGGQNVHNFLSRALIPLLGKYAPAQTNIDFGQTFGVNDPNLGDKLLQGAAQFAPYMALPGGALAQGAAFGATQSQNPVTGTLTGGALGAAGEFAPALIKGAGSVIGKAADAMQPQKQAQQILNTLGSGNTLEGNAQSLASDIKNAYNQRVMQGQQLYNPVFDALGSQSIYGANNLKINSNYLNVDNSAINGYDRNLNKLHQQFLTDPTLQNAHNLQSQLGTAIRKLQTSDAKGNLSVADRGTMQGYQAAQSALRSDIGDFLNSQNPQLANQYDIATANWAQNVTPYLENSKIAQIAKGDVTNPNAITNLFKNPEPEIQQIVNDIGPQAANKILYSELGKTQANLTPEKLTNVYSQLDNKGLSSYVTPDIAQQFDQLANKTTARNAVRTAGGALVGAHFGGPLGAATGAIVTPLLSNIVSRSAQYLPTLRMQLLGNALPKAAIAYKPLTGAITADTVNSLGGQ